VVRHYPQCLSVGVRRSIRDHAVSRWLPLGDFGAVGDPPLRAVPFVRRELVPSVLGTSFRTVHVSNPVDVAPVVVTRPSITFIVGSQLLCYSVTPPRSFRFAPTFPVLGLRRTIRAPAPLCLLPNHFYDPHSCVPFSTDTCLSSPATHPSAAVM